MNNFEQIKTNEWLIDNLPENWYSVINSIFKKEYPAFWDLKNFLNKENKNPFEEKTVDSLLNNSNWLIEKSIRLLKLSNNPNLNIENIQFLLSTENASFLPLEAKEKLKEKLNQEILESAENLKSIFINKDKIKDFLSENNSSELLEYINFLNSLSVKQREYLALYLLKPNKENKNNLSYSTIKWLSYFSPFINNDKVWLFESNLKKSLNDIIFELIKNWNLSSFDIYTYTVTEEGLLWIDNRVGKIWVDYSEENNESQDIKLDYDYENIKWFVWIKDFFNENLDFISFLLLSEKISNNYLEKFLELKNQFNDLSKNINRNNGFIPWEIQEMQYKFDKIEQVLALKNDDEKEKVMHSLKMARFLNSAISWLTSSNNNWYFETDTDISEKQLEQLEQIRLDAYSGKIKSFTEITDRWIIDLLGSFYEDMYESMEISLWDKWSITDKLAKLWLEDHWYFDINMENLDRFVDQFWEWTNLSFSKIESATAQMMVDNSPSNKMPAFNLMLWNILEKNNIQLSEAAIKEKQEELNTDVNINNYLGEVLSLSRIDKEKILINSNTYNQEQIDSMDLNDINDAVTEIIKDKSSKRWAEMMLYIQEIITLYETWALDWENKLFVKEYLDWKNWAADIASMLIKEAIIMTTATLLTAGTWTILAWALVAWNWASKLATAINLSRKAISTWSWITSKTARVWISWWKIWIDSFSYLAVSDIVYDWDQLTWENFIQTYWMFLWGITWMKIWWRFIKSSDAEFTKQLKNITWWAVWWTIASTWVLVFWHWENITEIEISSAWEAMIQWLIMWWLMMPLMKGWHNIWRWWWNKIHNGLNNSLYRKIIDWSEARLKSLTSWKSEYLNQQLESFMVQLWDYRSKNLFLRVWRTSKLQNSLNEKMNRLKELKDTDFDSMEQQISAKTEELNRYRISLWKKESWFDKKGVKQLEEELAKLNKDLSNLRVEMRKLEEKLPEEIINSEFYEDIISSLPSAHPLKRAAVELKSVAPRIQNFVETKWNNVRLERLKIIDSWKKTEWLWNGFYLKEWNTVINQLWKEVFKLPNWVKIEWLEYINIGNNRVIWLRTNKWELVRIYKEADWIPQKLMDEVLSWDVQVKAIYNKSDSKLAWYSVEKWWSISYYKINWSKAWENTNLSKSDSYFEKTVASSWRVNLSELRLSNIDANELWKIKRSWDKEIDKLITPDVANNLKESWIKSLKSVRDNPNSTPWEVKRAKWLLNSIWNLTGKTLSSIASKWFWTLLIVWWWALTVDKVSDWEFDLDTLWVWLAAWILLDDIWWIRTKLLDTWKKIPWIWGLINMSSPIMDKMKNWIPEKFRWVAWLWTILYAMHLYDSND